MAKIRSRIVIITCLSAGIALASSVLLAGCSGATTSTTEMSRIPIREPVENPPAGAAGWNGRMNVKKSPYFPVHDFFHSSPTPSLVKLPSFRTYQQTSERSCGAACALMTLEHFGLTALSEKQLDLELDIRSSDRRRPDGGYGCTTAALVKLFRARGLAVRSSLDTPRPDGITWATPDACSEFFRNCLRSDTVVLLENVTWGGHWVVLVGYDTMGTANCGDDVLILADPYDTADHCQDGYTVQSFDRFFSEWMDAGVLTPGITRQQFVAVLRK